MLSLAEGRPYRQATIAGCEGVCRSEVEDMRIPVKGVVVGEGLVRSRDRCREIRARSDDDLYRYCADGAGHTAYDLAEGQGEAFLVGLEEGGHEVDE